MNTRMENNYLTNISLPCWTLSFLNAGLELSVTLTVSLYLQDSFGVWHIRHHLCGRKIFTHAHTQEKHLDLYLLPCSFFILELFP